LSGQTGPVRDPLHVRVSLTVTTTLTVHGTPVRVSLTVTVTLTVPGCPGMVTQRPPLSKYFWQSLLLWPFLVVLGQSANGHPCQSIPNHHCHSDHPWLSKDGHPKVTPVRVSLTVTVTLTGPGCPGMVTQRLPLSEYSWQSL